MWHPSLVCTVVIVPVTTLLPGMVQVMGRNCTRLQFGEPLVLHVIVEVGHSGHGVHGSCHGRRGNGFGLFNTGWWKLACRFVVWNLREDKCTVHVDLLLRKGFVAIAAADGITWVVAATALFPSDLVFHLTTKHTLIGRDEWKPRRLELGSEQWSEDGRRARVVGWEAAVVWWGHVLLGARNGVESLQSICCPPQ